MTKWRQPSFEVWIVAVMMPVWWCLRRNLPMAAAAAAMVMMLVVPEVDGGWVAFGESSNVGFFSATATAFLVWDWWVGREGSRRWRVVSLGWVVVHVLTSPMAWDAGRRAASGGWVAGAGGDGWGGGGAGGDG